MWKWIKENAGPAAAVATVFVGFAAIAQFAIVIPIQQRFDEIDRRFDEMDRRFDDFKAEVNQRFDAQDKYINQRFDDQHKYINQRFDAVEERLGRLSAEVSDLRRLADRVSRNEGRLDAITQQLQAIDEPAP